MDCALVIVRHGQTARNTPPEKIRGWDNVPLDEAGRRQADQIGRKLANYRIAKIYTSDLQRASETAAAIQRLNRTVPTPTITKTRSLRPWNLGDFQGKPYEAVKHLVEDHQLRKPMVAVPGGESFHTFMARYLGFLTQKVKEAQHQHQHGLTLFVAHTRNVRGFKAWAKTGVDNPKVDVEHMVKQSDAPTGGAVFCEVRDGKVRLTEL